MDHVVLEVEGACKRFGETQALRGASLTVNRQEWLGLLGPNGAGKTTLVRAITGRVRLDEGRIRIGGELVDSDERRTAARRGMGIVSQEIALYPLLTARENLRAFAELSGLRGSQRDRQVAWGLDWTGLIDRADEPIKSFSGGMKRRLNIVGGILHDPKLVLLDEPTVGVDPQSRQRIWEMLRELRDRGASLLFTTHQLEEAEQLCDRIVIVDHGTTVAAGTFDELIAQSVGRERQVTIVLDGDVPDRWRASSSDPVDHHTIRCRMRNVAEELTPLLAEIAASGRQILDLSIERPSLQSVFIQLTGSEMRE
ncbi:MAG: ABC transporter ATP-binding protein [Pirellulaceae bacterium]